MMYRCKLCQSKTSNSGKVCSRCYGKIRLWRKIKAMLMPYYEPMKNEKGETKTNESET